MAIGEVHVAASAILFLMIWQRNQKLRISHAEGLAADGDGLVGREIASLADLAADGEGREISQRWSD